MATKLAQRHGCDQEQWEIEYEEQQRRLFIEEMGLEDHERLAAQARHAARRVIRTQPRQRG